MNRTGGNPQAVLTPELQKRLDFALEAYEGFQRAATNLSVPNLETVINSTNFDVNRNRNRGCEKGLQCVESAIIRAIYHVRDHFRDKIVRQGEKLRALGEWPETLKRGWINFRFPDFEANSFLSTTSDGWCSAMAIPLGFVEGRDVEKMSAALVHPECVTEALIRQIHREIGSDITQINPESATACWLASKNVESDKPVNLLEFVEQVAKYQSYVFDDKLRKVAAITGFQKLGKTFQKHPSLPLDIPYGDHPRSIESAYVHGHPLGVRYSAGGDYYMIETFWENGLGLENFQWRAPSSDARVSNGPIEGDPKRAICLDIDEVKEALFHCRRRFASELKPVDHLA